MGIYYWYTSKPATLSEDAYKLLEANRKHPKESFSVEDPRGIFSFVAPRHPPRPAAIPFPIYFQNTL
jgi:hypothetical protein